MPTSNNYVSRRSLLQSLTLLGTGFFAGRRLLGGGAPDHLAMAATNATPDATATRDAELDELHALQTQVAQPMVCTPPPTNTPTPTPTQVPPAQTGVPVSYNGDWTITVLGIAPTIAPNDFRPTGKLMQVNLTASHRAATPKFPALNDFRLVDSTGQFSVPDLTLSQALYGANWGLAVQVGVTENIAIAFDVAKDAGDNYILESNADPTFRVAMTVEQRG